MTKKRVRTYPYRVDYILPDEYTKGQPVTVWSGRRRGSNANEVLKGYDGVVILRVQRDSSNDPHRPLTFRLLTPREATRVQRQRENPVLPECFAFNPSQDEMTEITEEDDSICERCNPRLYEFGSIAETSKPSPKPSILSRIKLFWRDLWA